MLFFEGVVIGTNTNQYSLNIGFYGPIKEGIYHLILENDIITDPPRFNENSIQTNGGILMKSFSINYPTFRIEIYNNDLSDLAYYLYYDVFENIKILAGNMLVIDSLVTFYNKKPNKNFNIKGYFKIINIKRIEEDIKNEIILNCQIIENLNEIISSYHDMIYFYYDSRIQCHSTLNEAYEGICLKIPIFDIYSYKNKIEEYKYEYGGLLDYGCIDNIGLKEKNTYQSPKSIIKIEKIEIKNEIKNYLENDVPNYLVENELLNVALYGEIIRGNSFNQKKIDNNMKIEYNNNALTEIYDLNIDINGKNIEINGIMNCVGCSHYKSIEHIFTLTKSFLATSTTDNEKDYQLIEPFKIKKIFSVEQVNNYQANQTIVQIKILSILLTLFILL